MVFLQISWFVWFKGSTTGGELIRTLILRYRDQVCNFVLPGDNIAAVCDSVREAVPQVSKRWWEFNVGSITPLLHEAPSWLETAPDRGCGPSLQNGLTRNKVRNESREERITFAVEHAEAATYSVTATPHSDTERAMKAVRFRSSSINLACLLR